MTTATLSRPRANPLTAGRLPRWAPWALLVTSMAVSAILFALVMLSEKSDELNLFGILLVGAVLYAVLIFTFAWLAEGHRRAVDRLMTTLITSAFILALFPLVSLLWTVIAGGLARMDSEFFSYSMRNVTGEGGGAVHAILGTLQITGLATLISVPVGLFTAIYLVEYGRGWLARAITFFIDVMTGIPSIVAGLFAFALFAMFFGPGVRMGFGGAVALSVLMIPVVVRSSEEMLKLVPNELREASFALGVPKWLTISKVVIPTAIAGITTGVMISISRVIGETAPLLIIAGFTTSMNYNMFNGPVMTLPVFVYNSYANPGTDVGAYLDRAWAGALTLILIVMLLNLGARIIARVFSPKLSR
ncbi:phosphate ABC transporter permease PstA [Klugiella xanthotipulae]|uniref:Phosphate transport system permease protein PstA n=1 Tax=Klugiella xanthotipulae TaxID=244735 RepID=A0A543HYG3_9MICO|nr:phosphate ABC transporter permease PstA [Klugiella xanthotipulae]TQM63373.1 phosphate ABC transporter membrane protein 2 (PhoT family) [Klugiella xanthotipulae]